MNFAATSTAATASLKLDQTPLPGVGGPRREMAMRLPRAVQPFLTWITSVPGPGERASDAPAALTLVDAAARIAVGVVMNLWAMQQPNATWLIVALFVGLTLTTSGMGIVQVVIFHYCAHGTMFDARATNLAVGRAISTIFVFSAFEKYRAEHLQHHRAERLFTEGDEFSSFLVRVCRMKPGEKKEKLWRRTVIALFSPAFHLRFVIIRIRGCCLSRRHAAALGLFWAGLIGCVLAYGSWSEFLVCWVFPLTVLLQIATVFRILCEHRVPSRDVLEKRGKALLCYGTTGVFPGRLPPSQSAHSLGGMTRWAAWWLDLITVQLFCRIFVLVGDAPCHDFHHRRPGSREWPNARYARAQDKAKGCPGYPANYIDAWGLMDAIDANFDALSRAEGGAFRPA